MPLTSDILKVEISQKPLSKEAKRSSDGWNMLRARISNESGSSIAYRYWL